MLKSFTVKNYRNLNISELKPNNINILIGPNNSGKSNFIDAISFLSNLILKDKDENGTVFLTELSKRGWDDLLDRRKEKPNKIQLEWIIKSGVEEPDLCYNLNFNIPSSENLPPSGYYISLERLANTKPFGINKEPFEFFNCHSEVVGKGWFTGRVNGKVKRASVEVNPTETIFNQLDRLLDSDKFRIGTYPSFKSAAEPVKEFFNRFYAYSFTKLDLNKVREPAGIQLYNRYLKEDASNFVNVINYLDDNHKDFLDLYTERLKELIPDFKRLRIINPKENQRTVFLDIGEQRFKLSEMSDGTLKAMIIALLLFNPEKTTMLSFDEPELNLHPAWLKVISTWMQKSNSANQLFISTHSPDLLDGFTEAFREGRVNLYASNLNEQESLRLVTSEHVNNYFEEGWQLGDLYRIGHPELGGWPW